MALNRTKITFGVELEEGMADGGGEGVLFPAPGGGVRSV